jgi:hypothetical protein
MNYSSLMKNHSFARGISLGSAGFLLLCGSIAFAEPEAPAPKPPAEKKICKNIEETGSRLSRRKVCATAEVWEAQARDARSDISSAANKR